MNNRRRPAFRNGVQGLPYAPPLDVFTNCVVGLSVRKLRSDYAGPCMRVCNATNDEVDIFFDDQGYIDVAAILSFLPSSGELRIKTWYDQSLNAQHYTNNTAFLTKFRIRGAAIENINGKAALLSFTAGFGNSNQYLTRNESVAAASAFITGQALVGGVALHYVGWHNNNGIYLHDGLGILTGGSVRISAPNNGLYNIGSYIGGSPARSYRNGTQIGSATTINPTIKTLGRVGVDGGGADLSIKGRIQEYLIFSDAKTADRIAIENNINTYFSVY